MKRNRVFNLILSIFIILGTLSPSVSAASHFEELGQRAIAPVEKEEFDGEVFVSKPLVILMDYKDYNHEQLTEFEDWTINGFDGAHFTPEFFEQMFFGNNTYTGSDGREFITINKFYKESSGGSFSVEGGVAGWYTSEHNAKYYGGSQSDATYLVMEAIEKAAADSNIDLSQFDIEDKWDHDKDGNYYESDGIIDTLIIVHAGKGEEWGNSLGEDAIWPFRAGLTWYNTTNYEMYEVTDGQGRKWLADDFVVIEQDLPLDLLAHEYGHVLGLPDLYSTGGSYPPVENWSLMGGSYTGIIPGTFPNDYGAWCKRYLQDKFSQMFENDGENNFKANWQNKVAYDIDEIDSEGVDVILDQTSIKGKNKDTVRIDLPQKETIITTPPSGEYAYFSGKGDNLLNYMTTVVDMVYAPNTTVVDYVYASDVKLSFKTWYDIDPGFDFCSVQVRENDKEEWTAIEGNITTTEVDDWVKENESEEEIRERNPGYGITNDSGGQWVDAEFDLSQYTGKKIELRFRWRTDSNTPEQGIYIDDIKITANGEEILFDDADGEEKFTLEGFEKNDGKVSSQHYYLLEWRNNTGDIDKLYTSWSETQVYDPGLVIWYIDEMWIGGGQRPDQNTAEHPGRCFAGVVDAGQEPVVYEYTSGDGGVDRVGYQMYDAAFSLRENSGYYISGSNYEVWDSDITPKPMFDDSRDYRSLKAYPEAGLILPEYDLRIFVAEESKDRSTARIHIMRSDIESTYSNDREEAMKIDSVDIDGENIIVEATGIDVELSEKAYIGYTHEETDENKEMKLTLEDGKYKAPLFSLNAESDGLWKVSFIILEDTEGNARAFYNSKLYSGYGIDLSGGDFEKSEGQYPAKLADIKIQSTKSKITKGASLQLKLTGTMDDGSTATEEDLSGVKWSSSDSKTATVDQNGLVKGILEGTLTVTAKIGGLEDRIEIKVVRKSYDKEDKKDKENKKEEVDAKAETRSDEESIEFEDVGPDFEWAKEAINELAKRNIIEGAGNNNFKPKDNITRAAFAKIIVKAFGLESTENITIFKDVSERDWYSEFVYIAASKGLIVGHNNEFRPNDEITREEMAVIIARTLQCVMPGQYTGATLDFEDDEAISDWAKESLSIVSSNGIIEGIENGRFAPKELATRAQAAVIVYRLLKIAKLL
ncbi:immune inhibitor A domain-containing protein [Brassicibacter mesophilus]|uniref:immune inhibitor A domain-containing protein n=1 Tax=Brassicibacter mesophilus TaxID=745119 RepID=UPI003D1F453F